MSAFSRLDLDNELDRNDETRNDEHFEDGDYPALKSNYDRRAHAHHMLTGHKMLRTTVFPNISQAEFKLKIGHCHNN